MNCPDCGAHMRCADSRDVETKSFGHARRRRYRCCCGKRFTSAEIIIGSNEGSEGVKCNHTEIALREIVDTGLRDRIRSLAYSIVNLTGGK